MYKGIAIIRPKMPNNRPEEIITTKTSRGCDFIDDEKIQGWSKKLSTNWMIINPENNQTELIKNSLKLKVSRLFVAAKMIMRTILINGPI